jgi:hypothetical protein
MEAPMLRAAVGELRTVDRLREVDWSAFAAGVTNPPVLSQTTQAIVRQEMAAPVGRAAKGTSKAAEPATTESIDGILAQLQQTILADQLRNEYTLHRQIHQWLAEDGQPPAIDRLNERVYAELFLMPADDPWLGLVPANAYSALPQP